MDLYTAKKVLQAVKEELIFVRRRSGEALATLRYVSAKVDELEKKFGTELGDKTAPPTEAASHGA